jgi:hypothetical protein
VTKEKNERRKKRPGIISARSTAGGLILAKTNIKQATPIKNEIHHGAANIMSIDLLFLRAISCFLRVSSKI